MKLIPMTLLAQLPDLLLVAGGSRLLLDEAVQAIETEVLRLHDHSVAELALPSDLGGVVKPHHHG